MQGVHELEGRKRYMIIFSSLRWEFSISFHYECKRNTTVALAVPVTLSTKIICYFPITLKLLYTFQDGISASLLDKIKIITRPTSKSCSVQFSHSVESNSLQLHRQQHASPCCPSPTPRAYSNSCPWHRWCHPTISSRHPLLLPPSIFPSIRVFSNELVLCNRWPKYWSFSFNISLSNEYSVLISFIWTGWIPLQSKGLSRVFSNITVQKHQFFDAQLSLQSNSHIHTWLLEKP